MRAFPELAGGGFVKKSWTRIGESETPWSYPNTFARAARVLKIPKKNSRAGPGSGRVGFRARDLVRA